jgi:hypothetical protein
LSPHCLRFVPPVPAFFEKLARLKQCFFRFDIKKPPKKGGFCGGWGA